MRDVWGLEPGQVVPAVVWAPSVPFAGLCSGMQLFWRLFALCAPQEMTRITQNLVAHLPRPQDQGCSHGEVPNSPPWVMELLHPWQSSHPKAERTSQTFTSFHQQWRSQKLKQFRCLLKWKLELPAFPSAGDIQVKTRRWICNVDVFGKSAAPDTSGLCPAQECRNAISHVKFYRNNENPSFCRPCLQEYSLWQHSEISCFLPQTQIPPELDPKEKLLPKWGVGGKIWTHRGSCWSNICSLHCH